MGNTTRITRQLTPGDTAALLRATALAHKEAIWAARNFPPFASPHEGLAILQEEFMELQNAVFWAPPEARRQEMAKEAIQTAAMALRFIADLDLLPKE